MRLFRNGRPVSTVFDLLGSNENDMTASLAFVMASSRFFTDRLVKAIQGTRSLPEQEPEVHIQTFSKSLGITDIELSCGNEFVAILEAKRNASLPGNDQLVRYSKIIQRRTAEKRFLVTVSSATDDFARMRFPEMAIDGIPLVHLTWRHIHRLACDSIRQETNANKHLLQRFVTYLGEILGMENIYSNMVYVVSLAFGCPNGWELSWIDVVEKKNRYFYPIGKGWPDPPPNYMGFRYHAQLQSIRKVESFDIFDDPSKVINGVPTDKWPAHYCLRLGKPIIPPHRVGVGPRIVRAARCWCMLDTLLTSASISEAMSITKKREASS